MHDGAPQRDRVEPAAAPPPAGHRTELVADARQILAGLVEQFRRKRTRADAGGIGFDDAEHLVQPARTQAGAGGGAARGGGRGSHVRIGAQVHIQHGALGSLEQRIAAIDAQLLENAGHVRDQGLQSLAELQIRFQHLLEVDGRDLEIALQDEIVVIENLAQLRGEAFAVKQVRHPHGAARDLVLIGRADSAPRRADGIRALRLLACAIERHVRGQYQRARGTHAQTLEHRHPLPDQHLRLLEQAPRATAPRHCRSGIARAHAVFRRESATGWSSCRR